MIETSSIFLIGCVDELDVIVEKIDKVVGVKQNYTTGHVGQFGKFVFASFDGIQK